MSHLRRSCGMAFWFAAIVPLWVPDASARREDPPVDVDAVLAQARRMADLVEEPYRRSRALAEVGRAQARLGRADAARETLRRASEVADAAPRPGPLFVSIAYGLDSPASRTRPAPPVRRPSERSRPAGTGPARRACRMSTRRPAWATSRGPACSPTRSSTSTTP